MFVLSSFASEFQNFIYSYERQLEMPKIAFIKVTSLLSFFHQCTAQNKDIAFKIIVLFVYSFITCILFLITQKFEIYMNLYLKQISILYFGC